MSVRVPFPRPPKPGLKGDLLDSKPRATWGLHRMDSHLATGGRPSSTHIGKQLVGKQKLDIVVDNGCRDVCEGQVHYLALFVRC